MWRWALGVGAGGLAVGAASTALTLGDQPGAANWIHDRLPSRDEQLRKLSQGTAANPFDVLIIGGEAQGSEAVVWSRQ